MVKATYVDKNGLKKGAWTEEEDNKLRSYVLRYGHWNWRLLPKFAGIDRCGKSCRLRWMNYLKPGIKRGNYNEEERDLIAKLHHELGNKWSDIAAKLPGRTDNDIKNYWHTHLQKRQKRTTESGRLAEISEKEQSSEISNSENLEKDSDVSSAAPTLRSRKLRKSDVSYDVFILESSSSKSGDADWDPDSSSPDKNCSETLLELNPLSINSEATDDSGEFLDLLSGFHESFWTEPFMVDRCSYNHDYNFCIIDDGGLFSSPFMF